MGASAVAGTPKHVVAGSLDKNSSDTPERSRSLPSAWAAWTPTAGLTARGPLRLTRLKQKEKKQKLKNKKTLLSGISFLPTAPIVPSVAGYRGQREVHPEGAEGRLCKKAGHPLLCHRSNVPYPGYSPPSTPRLLLPNRELSPQRTA